MSLDIVSGLRRQNLKGDVATFVRELIFSGTLRPSQKIDQDALAAQLGVSRLPVREALIALETEGLVENIPRRGAFVAPISRDDIRDHYRIYGVVSRIAAERAAIRLSDETLEGLAANVEQMSKARGADRQAELNFEFHRLINVAGGSRRLLSAIDLFNRSLPPRFFELTKGWNAIAVQHHEAILRALRNRDPEEAGRAMVTHLSEGGEHAVGLLDRRGFWDEIED